MSLKSIRSQLKAFGVAVATFVSTLALTSPNAFSTIKNPNYSNRAHNQARFAEILGASEEGCTVLLSLTKATSPEPPPILMHNQSQVAVLIQGLVPSLRGLTAKHQVGAFQAFEVLFKAMHLRKLTEKEIQTPLEEAIAHFSGRAFELLKKTMDPEVQITGLAAVRELMQNQLSDYFSTDYMDLVLVHFLEANATDELRESIALGIENTLDRIDQRLLKVILLGSNVAGKRTLSIAARVKAIQLTEQFLDNELFWLSEEGEADPGPFLTMVGIIKDLAENPSSPVAVVQAVHEAEDNLRESYPEYDETLEDLVVAFDSSRQPAN